VSATTSIEWAQRTWNPTTGCDRISPGCDNCYALTMAKRLKAMGQARYQADGDPRTSGPGFALTLHPESIAEPHGWRKPSVVFVNSMSDLFHAKVPYEFVERVWSTMAETPRHTYQILTKRPDRMERFVARLVERFGVLPNVWLGTSVESQEYVVRAERLAGIPAAVRFLSVEPMLGPVELHDLFWRLCPECHDDPDPDDEPYEPCHLCDGEGFLRRGEIGWVIAGGESGHGARPCELDWLRSLRDRCRDARIPYFLKQLGGFGRVGKGGHEDAVLDGRRWLEIPA
jgi:protein gp37